MHINAQDMLGITVAFTRQLVQELLRAGGQDSGDVHFTGFVFDVQEEKAECALEEDELPPQWQA